MKVWGANYRNGVPPAPPEELGRSVYRGKEE